MSSLAMCFAYVAAGSGSQHSNVVTVTLMMSFSRSSTLTACSVL